MAEAKKWQHVIFNEKGDEGSNPFLLPYRISVTLNAWGVAAGEFVVLPRTLMQHAPQCVACLVFTDKEVTGMTCD